MQQLWCGQRDRNCISVAEGLAALQNDAVKVDFAGSANRVGQLRFFPEGVWRSLQEQASTSDVLVGRISDK